MHLNAMTARITRVGNLDIPYLGKCVVASIKTSLWGRIRTSIVSTNDR